MRSKNLIIILIVMSSLLIYNCSEVETDISQPPILEGVHSDGFGKLGSDNFHSVKIQENNWDLEKCQSCHAADYSGGLTNVSCLGCHSSNTGPEACNTCHGVFANENKIAPPNDLSGNFETTAKGVGAHTTHLYDNEISLAVSCFTCHPGDIGSGDFVKAHIDGLPAEINIEGYDNTNLTCSNTYCHGKFEFSKLESENQWAYTDSVIIGENFSPKWTLVDDTQAACGTCHLLPPTGHFNAGNDPEATSCIGCHSTAFNEDKTLNKFEHINGKKNLN